MPFRNALYKNYVKTIEELEKEKKTIEDSLFNTQTKFEYVSRLNAKVILLKSMITDIPALNSEYKRLDELSDYCSKEQTSLLKKMGI